MGLYKYINEQDRISMREVNDIEVKEVFQEALVHDPSLMIYETILTVNDGFFKKKKVLTYSIYHEIFSENGTPTYEAKYQISASGPKELTMAYLFGIINGSISEKRRQSHQ